MAYRPERNWGCTIAAAIFAIFGIPFLSLLMLGERVCDTGDPPCAISWGWMNLIYLAVILAICLVVGWLANRAIGRLRRDRDGGPLE
jgi:hypothetical protein